jgi:factor associated with neutral sphingomyelinase activation
VPLSQFLGTAQELHEVARADQSASEQRLEKILKRREDAFTFDMSWLEDIHEVTLMETAVVRVFPLVTTRGRILLTPTRLYLQPLTNVGSEPVLKIRLNTAERILPRRYLLRHVGVELFLRDRPSIFLVFHSTAERDAFQSHVQRSSGCAGREDLASATTAWRDGRLSNFDYLLTLNEHAGRSFMDLTQYPVFPWVLADYASPTLDLDNPASFRDLSRPIGALNPKRLADLRERYRHMPADEPKFLYGTHYSAPGYVLYYLVRKYPELMLKLQGGKFDAPDRLFASVGDTWVGVLNNASDVKEVCSLLSVSGRLFLS